MARKKKQKEINVENIKKIRVGVYIPEHLAFLAEQAFGSKSAFVTKAVEYFINEGGLRKWFREVRKKNES